MEGVEVKKKRRSTDSAETPTGTEIGQKESPRKVTEATLDGLVRKRFNLEHEVVRQDKIVEFLRSNDCSLDDIRKFGESTIGLFCEIYKVADARGERMNVQIPFLSLPYPEVISAMKLAIEGLIEDIEDVKNKVLSRKKVVIPGHSLMAAGNGLHDKKWNVAVDDVSRSLQEHGNEVSQQETPEDLEQGQGVTQQQEDVIPSDTSSLPFFKRRVTEEKPQLRTKKTRIMCQHCLDKPRNSVILRCKHSLYCNKCLNAGEEKISNCPGCGKEMIDIAI